MNTVREAVYLDKHFVLTADIDLGVAPYNEDAGWEPIGMTGAPFTGSFDGNGHTISNLFINRPDAENVGLFGVVNSANVKIRGIRNELGKTDLEMVSDKLSELIDATQSAHQEIREYIHDTRFSAMMEKGFTAELAREVEQFKKQTGTGVSLDIPQGCPGEALSLNKKINMLYIIKEALNNIRKHSEAENVQISLAASDGELCVAVKDDGKGFDYLATNQENNKTYGLRIMRERALEIGARLQIKSIPGKGCTISLYIPLPKGDEKLVAESHVG